MNTELIFWVALFVIIIELVAIWVLSRTIIAISGSESFKDKLVKLHEKRKEDKSDTSPSNGTSAKTTLVVLLSLGSFLSFASADASANIIDEVTQTGWITEKLVYGMLIINAILFVIIMYFRNLILTLLNIDKVDEKVVVPETEKVSYKVMHALTDAVSIEDEESVLTDHEYDGIHELDNNLPPWWKYGFYLSIVIGVLYFANYHVFKTGDLQVAEYNKVIEEKEIEIAAYLKAKALNVDENSVVMLTEASDLNSAKVLFTNYCVVCHGESGEGKVGPNLTDPYWIYDGDIKGIFSTIKYGAKRGMKSWKDELNPVQIQQLTSYIITLQGTNPDGAKPPEGDLLLTPTEVDPVKEDADSESTAQLVIH